MASVFTHSPELRLQDAPEPIPATSVRYVEDQLITVLPRHCAVPRLSGEHGAAPRVACNVMQPLSTFILIPEPCSLKEQRPAIECQAASQPPRPSCSKLTEAATGIAVGSSSIPEESRRYQWIRYQQCWPCVRHLRRAVPTSWRRRLAPRRGTQQLTYHQ